ncbi:MAG: nitrous oxide reductase accessory protein NosL [bacterium]
MKLKKVHLMLFVMAVIAIVFSGCSKKPDEGVKCTFCKMMVKLPENAQGAKIVFKDGSEEYYCCLAHALMGWRIEILEEAEPENPPVEILVVDYGRKEIIDARKATFVFGSDVPARMFAKSVVAFESESDAENFAAGHGGEVMDFESIGERNLTEMKEAQGSHEKE